jgi:transposase-like protein
MAKQQGTMVKPVDNKVAAEVDKAAESAGEVTRGRPGRRSATERREAVMALLSGKSSADQLARQYGVHADTVLGWRDAAVSAIEEAMVTGGGESSRERALEREVTQLRSALAQATLERAIAMQGVEEWKRASRPSRPARSRR